MNKKLNNEHLERYYRDIILKDFGVQGQKKISLSKILIVGAGGLGCPARDGAGGGARRADPFGGEGRRFGCAAGGGVVTRAAGSGIHF